MDCQCELKPIVTFLETPQANKIVEKHECPKCHQRQYIHRFLAEEGEPKLLGTGVLLCHTCNTMVGILVLHKGHLKCTKCQRENRGGD